VACLDDDKPKGFVYAYVKGKGYSPYSPGRDHLYVAAVCVDQDNRKKGIASALMKELVKSNSHRRICGQVLCSNAAAKKLYSKNGFAEHYVVFAKEAFKEADKSTKTASIDTMAESMLSQKVLDEWLSKNYPEMDYALYREGTSWSVMSDNLSEDLMQKVVAEGGNVYDTSLPYTGKQLVAREFEWESVIHGHSFKNSKYMSKPFEITSMAGGINCPYCGAEGFDTKEFEEHLKYCKEYLKIKDTPLARPLMKSSGTDEVGRFWIVTKPSSDSTLKDIVFEVGADGLQTYLEGFLSNEIEGIFTDKFVAETVAKSLLEAGDPDAMEKEGSEDVKRPSKGEIAALIKAYALMMFSKQLNAPMSAQQRYHDNCFDLIAKMEQKYPNISFSNDDFNSKIVSKATEWWNNKAMRGPAVDW
jgi:predicted GNAT family acetyltransferase